ncbi:hypothetical protein HPP92_005559 [Vanilla planifolia]|uniref:PCI domain-containing protein n=1 Tax=Vanilla planifolia TaxID=51239 RepID=A0A835RUA0_VANPL|nr:hypothetical protein HPP92_005559 [Vanilla planifolia]
MATFAKPENALKRAEELINVGQKQAALQALHDLITSKRYRAWQKTLERIMFKYVELCVDMRKGRYAKDGLIQYRIVCQQVNVSSLEEVIKYFMQLATERAEQAKNQAEALEDALDVEDLEADKRPEDLMLSYVSGEKGKDRSDRELVTPWFKFLWETYRTVLEILRNNSKLEALYAMTAHRAFQFCKQYKRTTEFRRLCEIIRNHLANLNKYRDQRDRPDLTAPESLQLYLDTRMDQLKIATDLELWQEAFRSVEDIHGLMSMVKKQPKPSLMLSREALLSELYSRGVMTCVSQDLKDLYNLLEHEILPLDLSSKVQPLLSRVSKLGGKLAAASSVPEVQLSLYIPYLENLTALRVLQQVSKVYNSIKIETLSKMIPFMDFSAVEKISVNAVKYKFVAMVIDHQAGAVKFGDELTAVELGLACEQHVVENGAGKRGLRMTHLVVDWATLASGKLGNMRGCGQWDYRVAFEASEKLVTLGNLKGSRVLVKDKAFGLRIDKLACELCGSEWVGGDLVVGRRLSWVIMCQRRYAELTWDMGGCMSMLVASSFEILLDNASNMQVLARKSIIEKRKEEHERQMLEREREEESKRLKQQKTTEEAEQRRLAEEYTRREEQRIRREIEERERLKLRH